MPVRPVVDAIPQPAGAPPSRDVVLTRIRECVRQAVALESRLDELVRDDPDPRLFYARSDTATVAAALEQILADDAERSAPRASHNSNT
jgi:hypothetical protein